MAAREYSETVSTCAARRAERRTSSRLRQRVRGGKNSGKSSKSTSWTTTTWRRAGTGGQKYWVRSASRRSRRTAQGQNPSRRTTAGTWGRARSSMFGAA